MLKSFLRISSSKVDRFTSNEDQNDHRSKIHIVEYISPAKMFRFCVIRERRVLQRLLVFQSGLTTASQTRPVVRFITMMMMMMMSQKVMFTA